MADGEKAKVTSKADGAMQNGMRLYNLKRWDGALKEFLSVNTENFTAEEKTELAYYLGLCYTKLAQYKEALLYLEQVVTAGQDLLRVYQCRLTLAYIYVITNRSKMAEFELKRLQNAGFESPQLFNTLAYAAWSQKNYKGAVDFYERALELDENNTTAMNGIGFILVDRELDLTKGLRYCRKAVGKRPRNPAYLDSLAWACFKNGELLEARAWIHKALDIAPHEKEIKQHQKLITGGAG